MRRCMLRFCAAAAGSAARESAQIAPHIAIIGAGPSGLYVADSIVKRFPDAIIDVYDQLPVPFGLSRYGVAPDHPEVKNVEKKFWENFKTKNVSFFGNMRLDKDLTVEELKEHYNAIVVSTGASASRELGIPGEGLKGVLPAKRLVEYYNSYPTPFAEPKGISSFDLGDDKTKKVIIIGNGNVAVDCARFLAPEYTYWAPTDANRYAIEELRASLVSHVALVARRGIEHTACTTAEFRELTTFAPSTVDVQVEQFSMDDIPKDVLAQRPKKRLLELMHKRTSEAASKPEGLMQMSKEGKVINETALQKVADTKVEEGASRKGKKKRPKKQSTIAFMYNRKPVKIVESKERPGRVGGVIFQNTKVQEGKEPTEDDVAYELVPCDAVITSIGYKSLAHKGVPFDRETNTIPNEKGRVTGDSSGKVYCSGWVKRGPKGVILHTMMDAQETAKSLIADLESGKLPYDPELSGKHTLVDRLLEKDSYPIFITTVEQVLKREKQLGAELGKRAEKFHDVNDVLDLQAGGLDSKRAAKRISMLAPSRILPGLDRADDMWSTRRVADLSSGDPHNRTAQSAKLMGSTGFRK